MGIDGWELHIRATENALYFVLHYFCNKYEKSEKGRHAAEPRINDDPPILGELVLEKITFHNQFIQRSPVLSQTL